MHEVNRKRTSSRTNTMPRRLGLGALAGSLLLLGACGDGGADPASTTTSANGADAGGGATDSRLAEIEERGVLLAGVKYDSPPYGLLNPETSEVEGFDVEMAREIAEHILGDPEAVEFQQAGTDSRIPMVKQGEVDVVLATMTITEERAQEIDFSIPYFPSGMAISVQPDSEIEAVEDIQGMTNCITPGSVAHELIADAVEERYGITDLEVIDLPSYPECVEALSAGRADFVGTDLGTLLGLREEVGGLRILDEQLTDGPWGVGVAQGNDQLLEAVNEAIRGTFEDGTWSALYEDWTGLEAPSDFPS